MGQLAVTVSRRGAQAGRSCDLVGSHHSAAELAVHRPSVRAGVGVAWWGVGLGMAVVGGAGWVGAEGLALGDEFLEHVQALLRAEGTERLKDDGSDLVVVLWGDGLEVGAEFGGELVLGEAGLEVGEGGLEGEEGLVRIAGAALEGLCEAAEVGGEAVRLVDDLAGEVEEVGPGEGMGVLAGFEGVEVAGRGADEARSEFEVAVGAAAGVAAHSPVAAVGHLTAGFVWVSGHGLDSFLAIRGIAVGGDMGFWGRLVGRRWILHR